MSILPRKKVRLIEDRTAMKPDGEEIRAPLIFKLNFIILCVHFVNHALLFHD